MKDSKILDFLFGYERSEESFLKSHTAQAEKNFSDTLIGGIGSRYAKRVLGNPLSRFFSRTSRALACIPVRAYGIAILVFGLITLLINFADYYFRALPTSPSEELVTGAVFTVVAIPLLMVNTPLSEFLQKYPLTDALFFDIFCLRRISDTEKSDVPLAWIIPTTVGTVIAVLGFFLPLPIVLTVVGALIFTALSFSSPEFSFMTTVFLLPVIPLTPAPSLVLACLVAITFISFFNKVLLGKRLYHFEQYDVLILLFVLFILISGIFNKGFDSFEHSVLLAVLSFSYFLASNIIVNRRLIDNTVNLFITSSVPTAIYGIIAYFYAPARPEWLDPSFRDSITSRAASTFGNPNIYAVFLLVAITFSLSYATNGGKRKYRPLYAAAFILNTLAMVLTWTRGAWLALILSVLAYLIIGSRRTPKILLGLTLAVPVGLEFIPSTVTERILSSFNFSDSSIVSRLSVWRSSLRMFADNIFIGIGVGEEAFSEEFLKYAEDSVTAPHSHNLFLEIGCEVGIFALILFTFLLLTRIRHRATYAKYVKTSYLKAISTVSGSALFALIAFGMTDYIWYSGTMNFLFWIVFGLGSATLRISKKERDDLLLESRGENSAYSAAADISVKG